MTHYYSGTQESSLSLQPVGEGPASMCNRRHGLLQGVLQAKQIEERKEVCNLFFSFTRRTEAQRYGMNCQGSYRQVVGEPEPELTLLPLRIVFVPQDLLSFLLVEPAFPLNIQFFTVVETAKEREGKTSKQKNTKGSLPFPPRVSHYH